MAGEIKERVVAPVYAYMIWGGQGRPSLQAFGLDRFAIACTGGGTFWSAATGRRFVRCVRRKAVTSHRTPKPVASSFPYTEVKTDLGAEYL